MPPGSWRRWPGLCVRDRRHYTVAMQWTQQFAQLRKKQDQLVGAIHQRYGTFKELAQKQMGEWRTKLSNRSREKHH